MPPRPFPSQLRVGTDICSVQRIWRAFVQRQDRFLKKFLTPRERLAFTLRYRISSPAPLDEIEATRFTCDSKPDAKSISILTSDDKFVSQMIRYEGAATLKSVSSVHEGEKTTSEVIKPIAAASAYLAGRWAAKEATIKAVKPRKLSFNEIEIWDLDLEPVAIILDRAPDEPQTAETVQRMNRTAFDMLSGQIVRVSISHDNGNAIAMALATEEMATDGNGDVGAEAVARM